jgi:hypothetical protein
MGVGFPKAQLAGEQKQFLLNLRHTAQKRNQDLMGRVNQHLKPVELDYEKDVLVLTPGGNATERHMCFAYAQKAKEIFNDEDDLAKFWSEKLCVEMEPSALPNGRQLLDAIRAKTMKRGGVGYVPPDKGSFPTMADTNRFILASGAIPVHTWLDGTSQGEKDIDRNYTPGAKDEKTDNLYHVIEVAEKRHLPVVVGTEMNSPGQKFVDDYKTEELSPLVSVFLKSAHIFFAHSVLQQKSGLGYTSEWAKNNFNNVVEKNKFFEQLGIALKPQDEDTLIDLNEDVTPEGVLEKVTHNS